MRYALIFVLGMTLLHCGDGNEAYRHGAAIPRVEGPSAERFPGKRVLSSTQQAYVGGLQRFNDLLRPHSFIKLEDGEGSILGEVTDLVFHQQHWFVLDQHTYRVYKFGRNGAFVKSFGGRGEGPGQFQYPKKIRVVYDGLLAVSDPMLGTIQVFDSEGQYIRATRPKVGGYMFPARYNFVWDQADSLVLPAFSSVNPATPQHVVLDASARRHHIRFGFGDRIESVEKAATRGAPKKAYTAFERVEGLFWSGSPYRTHIEVFDAQGRHVARLGEDVPRNYEEMVQPDDVDDLNLARDPNKKLRETILTKSANLFIGRIGDLVLVQMGFFFDVYDYRGNLVRANLKAEGLYMRYTFSDYLVMPIELGREAPPDRNGRVRAMLDGAGLSEDDNPGLLIYKLYLGERAAATSNSAAF